MLSEHGVAPYQHYNMPNRPNLLAQVRLHLRANGEDYQWITMGPDSEKIGLAYIPRKHEGLPCTFMFTELKEPCSLVFDVNFAYRIAPEDKAEVSMLLLTLNANLPEGQLLLEETSGLVYYRLKFVVDDLAISEEAIRNRVAHMEKVGLSMAQTYARIITEEFPAF